MPEIGEYIIVRAKESGCTSGEYQGHIGREVRLTKARTIWSWNGNRLAIMDVAVVPGECRLTREAPGEVTILDACQLIPTTPEVEQYLRTHVSEQNAKR